MAARKVQDSPTRLTEFAPLSSDARPTGGFFSRLFKRNTPAQADGNEEDSSSGSSYSSREPSQSREITPTEIADTPQSGPWEPESVVVVDPEDMPSDSDSSVSSSTGGQPRTLSSVLRRLSNILDRRSQTPQAYKDSDFKQYWMPDSDCRECYECSDKFNTFRRRHHCRICGQIFCSRCCNQEVPGKIMGYTGYLRVCTYCCKVVLSYAQHQEATGDLRALSEDLKHLSAVEDSASYHDVSGWTPTSKRKGAKISRVSSIFNEDKQRSSSSPELHSPTSALNPFDVTPLSEYSSVDNFRYERRILTQDSVQLRELWRLMQHSVDGMEMQSHRHRLRTYPNCVVGSELVDWLIARDKAADRVQAVAIGQALVDAKWLECVTSAEQVFSDEYSLYRPGEATTREDVTEVPVAAVQSSIGDDEDNAPSWFREIRRTDEDADSLSELNKIPSTVSGNDLSEGMARSVFYVDGGQIVERPRKFKPTYPSASHDRRGATNVVTLLELVNECSLWGEYDNGQTEGEKGTRQKTNHGGAEMSGPPLTSQDSASSVLTEDLLKGALAMSTEKTPSDDVTDGHTTEFLKQDDRERLAYDRLNKAYKEHLKALTNQLLTRAGLSLKWAETVLSVTRKIAQVVRPDVKQDEDDMDIRQYVQIKKIPGESRIKTSIICGVVCTKNVTHKKMRQHIVNPKVLLLRAPIEYQRVENKFSSLEPQILQEDKFLKNCVGRIAALEPDILLVEKSASRVAQEFLLAAGITLVLNVKPSVMERVARFTQADIVSSIDGLVSKTSLGFCHNFFVNTFTLPNGITKTLMYFDGCASHLGCTVTLRGGSSAELKRVKQIMQFMTYATYHSRLETAFLMDEYVMPPPGPDENEFPISSFGTSPTKSPPEGKATPIDKTGQRDTQSKAEKQPESNIESKRPESNIESRRPESNIESKRPESNIESRRLESNIESKRTENVEMAEEAMPRTVATKDVVAMFEGSDRSVDIGEEVSDVFNEKQTRKDNAGDPKVSNTSTTTVEPVKKAKVANVTASDNIEKAKKAEAVEATESPSRNLKRLSRDGSTMAEVVQDFSDPLQNYQKSKDESIFESTEALREVRRGTQHRFRHSLDDVILTISPYMKYDVPFLKTEAGETCVLRVHFPKEIYWSPALQTDVGEKVRQRWSVEIEEPERPVSERLTAAQLDIPHPFVTAKLTAPLGDPQTQALLVDFRARGGRIQQFFNGFTPAGLTSNTAGSNSGQSGAYQGSNSIYTTVTADKPPLPPRSTAEEKGLPAPGNLERRVDCLDPYQHQRIAVLFSSFSYVSNNSPNPCVNPWIVNMDFYGRNDITLGGFLERYCFREMYACPSESCDTPMVDHIRRFVHESGCVQIVLKKLDAPIQGYQTAILTWSWCRKCKQVTPVVPLSLESWSMSFAKYLELRFHGNMFTRRSNVDVCSHAVHHEYYQYFGSNQIVASFKYVPIQLKEIALPPIIIQLEDSGVPLSSLVQDAKTLSFNGTDVYSTIMEHLHRLKRDAQSEAQATLISEYIGQLQTSKERFRQCVDEIQSKLSAACPMLYGQSENTSAIDDYMVLAPVAHDIADSIVEVKRQIAETVTNWNSRIQDFVQQQRKIEKARGGPNMGLKGSRDALNTVETVSEPAAPARWQHKDEAVDIETEPTFFVGPAEKSRSRSASDSVDQEEPAGES